MGAVRDQAIAQVTVKGATASRPVIEAGDVGVIVDAAALPDPYGVLPGGVGWSETYDVNAAIAAVWRAKAGKVAGDYSFSADGASYNKGDVLAHCLEMETVYASKAQGSLGTIQIDGTTAPANVLDAIALGVIP